jgi:tetratricopeptide (TPR) repeat protein
MGPFRTVLDTLRKPRHALAAFALVGLIGLSLYVVLWSMRGDPNMRKARQALAKHDLQAARQHLMTYLESHPADADGHFLLARTARRLGDYPEAWHQLRKCARLGGIPEAVELEELLIAAQRGELQEGEAKLRYYVKTSHPDKSFIQEALTHGYIQAMRPGDALDCVQSWLEQEPDNAAAWFLRGKAYEILMDTGEALANFERAVELDPALRTARLALAEQLLATGRPQAALEHFQYLDQEVPDSRDRLLGQARAYADLGRLDDGRVLLDRLLTRHPEDVQALTTRGRLELASQRPATAEPWLRKALARSPYERDATYLLHSCMVRLGNKAEAARLQARLKTIGRDLKRLQSLVEQVYRSPQDPSPRCAAGKIFLDIGNDKEGLRWLESALKLDSNHAASHRLLADYYRRTGAAELASRHEQALGGY